MPGSYARSFIKDNATVIAGNILVYMKGIILMPLVIKTVGVTIYGGFVLFSSVLGIIFGIHSLGAGFRAKRFLPAAGDAQARRALFYPQFFFGFFSILFFSLFLSLLNTELNRYIFKNEISFSVLIIPVYFVLYFFYSQGSDYFRYTSRVKYMTVAGIFFAYLHIGFISLFYYYYGYININILVLSQALCCFLIAFPCFCTIFKELGFRFQFYQLKELVSDIKVGFPLVLGFIVDFILAGSDRYLIAFFMTVSAVGYYNPGYVLGSLVILVPKAIGGALPQLMSRAVDSKREHEAEQMLNYALKIFLFLAIPFIFGSLVFGKSVLTIFADSEVAEQAYFVTPIVALGTLFYGLSLILSNVLFVRMKTYLIFKMNVFASLFNLVTNLVLLYLFRNIIFAAITTFLSYFISFLYINKKVREGWPIRFSPAFIFKVLASSIFMSLFLCFISSAFYQYGSVFVLGIKILSGVFVYVGSILMLKTFSEKEINFIKEGFSAIRS